MTVYRFAPVRVHQLDAAITSALISAGAAAEDNS